MYIVQYTYRMQGVLLNVPCKNELICRRAEL